MILYDAQIRSHCNGIQASHSPFFHGWSLRDNIGIQRAHWPTEQAPCIVMGRPPRVGMLWSHESDITSSTTEYTASIEQCQSVRAISEADVLLPFVRKRLSTTVTPAGWLPLHGSLYSATMPAPALCLPARPPACASRSASAHRSLHGVCFFY